MMEWLKALLKFGEPATASVAESRAVQLEGKDLDAWCLKNFLSLHPLVQQDCLDHLDGWIPEKIIKDWKRDGFDPGFHFLGGGMQIRNRLREVLLDEELPAVTYGNGDVARNWDDYYTGALHQLMERYE